MAGDHPYCEIGRPRITLTVVSKSQKPHRNHVEDTIGETYSPAIRRSNKSRGYSIISYIYGGDRA